jgi:dUTP pyrophosphatase
MNAETSDTFRLYMTRLHEDAILPSYAHHSDAGMDVYAASDIVLLPGDTKLIPTGIAIAMPEGYEAQIRPRSGISLRTMLRIPNSPGTIDAGYRDEICIIMNNASQISSDSNPDHHLTLDERMNRHGSYLIRKGDKIAQMVFAKVSRAQISEVQTLEGIGIDRQGGFGSTGT